MGCGAALGASITARMRSRVQQDSLTAAHFVANFCPILLNGIAAKIPNNPTINSTVAMILLSLSDFALGRVAATESLAASNEKGADVGLGMTCPVGCASYGLMCCIGCPRVGMCGNCEDNCVECASGEAKSVCCAVS